MKPVFGRVWLYRFLSTDQLKLSDDLHVCHDLRPTTKRNRGGGGGSVRLVDPSTEELRFHEQCLVFWKWKVWCDGNLRRASFLKKKWKIQVFIEVPRFSMGKVFAKLQVNKTTLRWMVLLMVKRDTAKQWKYVKHRVQLLTRWWFQFFFGIFTPICGGFPFWLIFFNRFNHQPVKRGSIILLVLEASPDFPKSAKTKDASSKKKCLWRVDMWVRSIQNWTL